MSRSRDEKKKNWNPARRYLKNSLRERRRLSEKKYLHELTKDPDHYEREDIKKDEELDNIDYWE